MTSRGKLFSVSALLALVAMLTVVIIGLHRDNAKLREQADALRRRNEPVTRLVAENQSTRELLARVTSDAADARDLLHQDVLQLRAEVQALEERARAAAAQKVAAAAAIATNREPEKALTPLENFQNVGRGSPAAAVQTLIWAALKAEESTLTASLVLMDDAREEALQLLAHLPDSARAKYSTPESLAALVVTNEILRADAVQITTTTPTDARHVVVGVRVAGVEGDEKVPTELTADGWKVMVPKKMILGLEQRLRPPAPKK